MPKVLVVDDQLEARKPLDKLLRMEGYEVVTAANSFEAMAAAKREQPDLILLDVLLPPVDGLTFLFLLREDQEGRSIPVILITGMNDEHTVKRAEELGVKAYLVKTTFTPQELMNLVRQHIRQ